MECNSRRVNLFLIGQALADTGNTSTQVAVFWTALSLSGSALSLGALGGGWTLTMAVANLFSGAFVDRFNRRNSIVLLDLILGLIGLAVFALSALGQLEIWHLWLFLVTEGLIGTPIGLACSSLLPDLVSKQRLTRVNSLLSSWGSVDNLAEAAVSGIVIGIWGPTPVFLFHALTYFAGALLVLALPANACEVTSKPTRWNLLKDLRTTIRYTIKEPLLRRVVPLDLLSGSLFAPFFFMGPLVAQAVGAGPQGYGFFQTLLLGGLLVGSLIASSLGVRWPKVPMWIGGAIVYSLGFLALGLKPTIIGAYVVFFLFGLGWTGGRVYGATLLQQTLPSAQRGRILGITGFAGQVLQPLALAGAMILVDRRSLGFALILLSAMKLAISGLQLALLPLHERDWNLSELEGMSEGDG